MKVFSPLFAALLLCAALALPAPVTVCPASAASCEEAACAEAAMHASAPENAVLKAPAPSAELTAALSSEAEGDAYAVAPTEDVWFYTGESEEERLFLLPCSYYVRVLDEGETFCAVEYAADESPYKKLLGYCRTESLLFVGFVPERPYLNAPVTLTYALPDAGGLGDAALSQTERTFAYYGERTEGGQLYYYVYDGATFGYVPAAEHLTYERNTDYLEAASAEKGGEEGAQGGGLGGVQIAVICILCAAAVAVAVLVLRGKRSAGRDDRSSEF